MRFKLSNLLINEEADLIKVIKKYFSDLKKGKVN